MHIIGHDNLGRPIIYSCLAAAIDKVCHRVRSAHTSLSFIAGLFMSHQANSLPLPLLLPAFLQRPQSFEDNHDHLIQTFEAAIRCMPPGVEQLVWCCDMHGFGEPLPYR